MFDVWDILRRWKLMRNCSFHFKHHSQNVLVIIPIRMRIACLGNQFVFVRHFCRVESDHTIRTMKREICLHPASQKWSTCLFFVSSRLIILESVPTNNNRRTNTCEKKNTQFLWKKVTKEMDRPLVATMQHVKKCEFLLIRRETRRIFGLQMDIGQDLRKQYQKVSRTNDFIPPVQFTRFSELWFQEEEHSLKSSLHFETGSVNFNT